MTTGTITETYKQPLSIPPALRRAAAGTALAAVALGAVSAWFDWTRFACNSLVVFVFTLTLGLGCLFLVALEYTVNATWSVPFRRISENLAALIPASLVLAFPVLLGLGEIYEWTHAEVVQADAILAGKSSYLNVPFFLIRFVLFYAVWIAAYLLLAGGSRRQDRSGDPRLTKRASKIGPVFIIFFVITVSFAAFDWLMSLTPHWYSSIFGVYLLVGSIVSGIAVTTLAAVLLKLSGHLPDEIQSDHFYSLGALLFALNTAWAYIAFAQYLLIWYANFPQEMAFYKLREHNGWGLVSGLLIVGHFAVPFLALLTRRAKTDLKRLRWVALWLLTAHALDIYWLVAPSARPSVSPVGWQELWMPFAAVAVGLTVWIGTSSRGPLLPIRDPRLDSSLHFHL